MAFEERKISNDRSPGVRSRVQLFEKEGNFVSELKDKIDEKKVAKKLERDMSLEITDNPSDKATIRANHTKNIKSRFDKVEDEDELKQIHEENMKLAIDKYIAGNSNENQKRSETISQFRAELDDDFEALLIMFRINRKGPESKHNQALENAKKFYIREMKNHFSEPKFILIDELQALHEKYKSLSHDKLREELSDRDIPRVREQLNRSIEISYDTFKRQNLSNIPIKPAIGIDLGTTYSCVGVINRGKVHIISNTYGLKTTPSYISFPESGQEFVGQSAKEQSFENPVNTIYDVKRMIGRNYYDIDIQEDMKLWPFEVVNEKSSLKVKLRNDDHITLYPEELSAKVLSRLKSDAENFLGYKVNNAVITVPAYFNDAQRQATKDAGLLAGLNVLQILNEPTAAAIAYNHQIREDFRKNVLIYDLGGGTFDVAVVVIENGIIDVKAVGGDAHLGGVDFDQRIMNYLFKTFKDEFGKNHREQLIARAKARLRNHCEKKKCELSEMNSTTISIDVLLPGWDFKHKLERTIFEDLCIDLFKKTIVITEQTLKSADIKACDINDVVLIGGSTKIPKIQSLLKEYFIDKTLNKEISPDEAVAFGATIQAALLNGQTFIDSNSTHIHDVSPFSLGIEVFDKSMAVIIPRNSKIPNVKSQIFKTAEKNQTFVRIQIYEGEDKVAKKNRLLGEFIIDGLPKKPAGEETVNVIMEIDKEGILRIKGVASSGSADLVVKDHRGRISAEDLKMLVNQLNVIESTDREDRHLIKEKLKHCVVLEKQLNYLIEGTKIKKKSDFQRESGK